MGQARTRGARSERPKAALPGRPASLAVLLAIAVLVGSLVIAGCNGGNPPRNLFLDGFDGTLSSLWLVSRPDTSLYTFTPSCLNVRCSNGTLSLGLNDYNNAFLIDNPTTGDFVSTMSVLRFDPLGLPYHQIGMLAYDDDDNYVRSIYGYISPERQLQFGSEVAAVWNSSLTPQDFGTARFYLRLTKTGNQYRQYYSTDGTVWTQANGVVTYGDGTPQKIGFIASDGTGGESRAFVDWFQVDSN